MSVVAGKHVDVPRGDTSSDYDRIGGASAVAAVVQQFYELVLADEELAPLFANSDLTRLKRHQVLLLSHVLGGPAEYTGRDLRSAHKGLHITCSDFSRVVDHLVTALQEHGAQRDIIERMGVELAGTEHDIVRESTP